MPKSLNIAAWHQELSNDPDREFLLNGISNGFKIVDSGSDVSSVDIDNYSSALAQKEEVEKQILEEIREGRYVITDTKPTVISALGALPKPKGVRLIHDCKSSAINDYARISDKQKYQTVTDAINYINPFGYMAKVDLKSAYRSVLLDSSMFHLTGLKWKFEGHKDYTYMYDTRLPFGARLAPSHFHRITQAVRRAMERRGYQLVVYLDDFLIISDSYDICAIRLNVLIKLLRRLGFSIAWEKTVGPSQCITFLGIQIDSCTATLSLPQEKVTQLLQLLTNFSKRSRASCRQLQQLAGKLNWAAHVVNGGRVYLQRVLDLIRPLKHNNHKVHLTTQVRQDIEWWIQFLPVFNSKEFRNNASAVFLHTDSSSEGAGMLTDTDWSYVNWKRDMPQMQNQHINVKETMAVIIAAYRWAPQWQGRQVIVCTDNMTTKAAISKGISRHPIIMPHLRVLFWLSNVYNFTFTSVHNPGIYHTWPDAVSRLHQPGQFLYWNSIVTHHTPYNLYRTYWAMAPHMSKASWFLLSQQIKDWSKTWTKQYRSTSP